MPMHKAAIRSIVIYSPYASPASFPGMEAQNWQGASYLSSTGVIPILEIAAVTRSPALEVSSTGPPNNMLIWNLTVNICSEAEFSRNSLISSAYILFSAERADIDSICLLLESKLLWISFTGSFRMNVFMICSQSSSIPISYRKERCTAELSVLNEATFLHELTSAGN